VSRGRPQLVSVAGCVRGQKATIEEAEQFGKVEIGYASLSGDRQVCIEMGKWGFARAMVWGKGPSIEEACGAAVARARMVAEFFPHPHSFP